MTGVQTCALPIYIADEILNEISEINSFSEVKLMDKDTAINNDLIKVIGQEIDDEYNSELLKMAINEDIDKEINVVYSPLNGTGNIPVRRILKDRGFTKVTVVPEQEKPDSNFTTVGYPNPEDPKAFAYAEKFGNEIGAELLIATDPDCDRVAIEVKNGNGYTFINGNQTGALIVNYVLSSRNLKNNLPKNPAIVKSIVTGDLGKAIANKYGVKTFDTLTGFKNICALPNKWDITKEYEFILGYEDRKSVV